MQGALPNGQWDWNSGAGTNGGGNLADAAPLFRTPVVPASAPTTAGDLRLRMGPPAINAGNNDLLPDDSGAIDQNGDTSEPLPVDLDGNPRVFGATVDLGAYELQVASAICTDIPAAECEALLALYDRTGGDNWWTNSGWKQTSTACDWYGVTCDGGHVTGLSLGANGLSGAIPAAFGDLASLQTLDLGYNYLQSLPAEFGDLASLQTLSLGYNMLHITDPDLRAFLDAKDPDWDATQTVPPTDVQAVVLSETSVEVRWTPIPYTGDGGYYQVGYATTAGGPYTLVQTADKTADRLVLNGLSAGETYYVAVRTLTGGGIYPWERALLSPFGPELALALNLGAAGAYIDAASGGSLADAEGKVAVTIPPGALSASGPISINRTGPGGSFAFESDQGPLLGLYIVLAWDDANGDGIVDGTDVAEAELRVVKDDTVITGQCGAEAGCDSAANTFTFTVTSWSEFILAAPPADVCANPEPTYTAAISVVDSAGTGHKGYLVRVYDLSGKQVGTAWTDAEGKVSFELKSVVGYTFRVEKNGAASELQPLSTMLCGDTSQSYTLATVTVAVGQKGYLVRLFNGSDDTGTQWGTAWTDANGHASFSLPEGPYGYQVEKNGVISDRYGFEVAAGAEVVLSDYQPQP